MPSAFDLPVGFGSDGAGGVNDVIVDGAYNRKWAHLESLETSVSVLTC